MGASKPGNTATAQFTTGQKVNRKAFTSSSGEFAPAMNGLEVYSVREIECQSIPNYFRVLAYGPRGEKAEGGEQFFEAETIPHAA